MERLRLAPAARRVNPHAIRSIARCFCSFRGEVNRRVKTRVRSSALRLPEAGEPDGGESIQPPPDVWSSLFDFVKNCESRQYRGDVLLVFKALKLAVDALNKESVLTQPVDAGKRLFLQKSLSVASLLIGLRRQGHIVDAETIAASIIVEEVASGIVGTGVVESVLGPIVASLVVDTLAIRHIVEEVEIFDDETSNECREKCMSKDVRALVCSLAHDWDTLRHCGSLPKYKQQQLALEANMVYVPIGHALGLGHVANQMESVTLKILFPQSVQASEKWLSKAVGFGPQILKQIKDRLSEEIQNDDDLRKIISRVELHDRVKSLSSFMRKVLSLDKIKMGGRKMDHVFDVLGLRVVVFPLDESEENGIKACYRIRDLLHSIWDPIPGRLKDYIAQPKPNGYRSLHTTLTISLDEHEVLLSNDIQGDEFEFSSHTHDPSFEATSGDVLVVDEFPIKAEDRNLDLSNDDGDEIQNQWNAIENSVMNAFDEFASLAEESYEQSENVDFFEVQIRTWLMDQDAREGGSAHPFYKSGISVPVIKAAGHWGETQVPVADENKLLSD
ncbi:hypothetical protein BSKO_08855 [Bryopsis sp. KO-2023]|nr:hypothetical protein BSKO_08855 [Bryopsis sp. KO-2023]